MDAETHSGPYDFLSFDIDVTKEASGNARDPAQTQPLTFVRLDAPPILLATGLEETTALPRNSKCLVLVLKKAGTQSVSLNIYPGLGHTDTATALARVLQ